MSRLSVSPPPGFSRSDRVNHRVPHLSPIQSEIAPIQSEVAKPAARRNESEKTPRTSVFRGVTKHRWSGKYEAHLWDKNSRSTNLKKKGKQVYLGAFQTEEEAAQIYDRAALKYWGGAEAKLNFPIETYAKEIEEMQNVSKEEYLTFLKRTSSGFSRGTSKYRGVARYHHQKRWEARIGNVNNTKYLYLGTYDTEEEAAAAYDMAALAHRGPNTVINFHISNYIQPLRLLGVDIFAPRRNIPSGSGKPSTEADHHHQQPPPPEQQQPNFINIPPAPIRMIDGDGDRSFCKDGGDFNFSSGDDDLMDLEKDENVVELIYAKSKIQSYESQAVLLAADDRQAVVRGAAKRGEEKQVLGSLPSSSGSVKFLVDGNN